MRPACYIFWFVLLLFPGQALHAQKYPKRIDSLLMRLPKARTDSEKVALLNSISFNFRNNDFEMALKFGNQALELSRKSGLGRGEARALNNLGLAYFYNSQIDTAMFFYGQSIDVARHNHDSDNIALGYNQMGNAYKNLSNLPMAADFLKRSIDVRMAMHDSSGAALGQMNLGSVYNRMGNYPLALNNLLTAQSIFEKEGKNGRSNLAGCYNGIGNTYMSQKDYPKARQYFQMATRLFREEDDKNGLATALVNIGNCLYYIRQYESALTYYFEALELRQKLGNPMNTARCLLNLGDSYFSLNDYKNGEQYYNQAFAIYKEKGTDEDLATVYLNMGTLYASTGRLKLGNEFLNKGLEYARRSGNISELLGTFHDASESYARLGDYKTAYELNRTYSQSHDSLFDIARAQTITQMQSTFDIKSKENEIDRLNKEKELGEEKSRTQQTIILSMSAIVLLLCLSGFLAYRGYKRTRAVNSELSTAYGIIEEKNKAITDSLDYAKKIQQAILPLTRDLERVFPSGFGLYGPRDVVSGDFYWFAEAEGNKFLLAAADCTGHGVPGAFMSMLGSDKLTHAVRERKMTRPGEILSYLNKSVKHTLKQNESDSELRDGMDIALCCFDFNARSLEYAGANRPLYHVRAGKLTEYRPTKAPIGGLTSDEQYYENHLVELRKDDMIYIFTDGYADQFGGPEGKKFMSKRLKELIISVSHLTTKEQEKIFVETHRHWKGSRDQVDDLLLIGIRV
jgi:serine phosphatase RsbU (regulator of sigma subunit)